MAKFIKLLLYPKLIVTHFIESQNDRLFYTGLCIMKNLLNNSPQKTADIIIEYEEVCIDSTDPETQTQKQSFLDKLW